LAQSSSRKKKRKQRPAPSAQPSGVSRSEAKNIAAREALEPLEPGERPRPVTIGAIVAVVLVVVQIPLYFLWDGDERPALPSFLFFCILMLVMAWGMWNARYWAVLGFQALLALAILTGSLALMVASNFLTALICLAIIVPAATLFWFMVKALARIQMPNRPGV
jgi:hypothetical protein